MGASMRPKLPGDKIQINDWLPPQQSMVASALLEIDQLKQLTTYVQKIETELQRHNELRGPMLLAFNPRGSNYARAMTNWERKSAYLLREIVKFTTYIDCLNAAQAMKEAVLRERGIAGAGAGQEEEKSKVDGVKPQVEKKADEKANPASLEVVTPDIPQINVAAEETGAGHPPKEEAAHGMTVTVPPAISA